MIEDRDIERLEQLADAATRGPWTVEAIPIAIDPARCAQDEIQLDNFVDHERRIVTAYEHPQLKGPDTITANCTRPYAVSGQRYGVYIREQDAAYIAAMHPKQTLELLTTVRYLKALNHRLSVMLQLLDLGPDDTIHTSGDKASILRGSERRER